MTLLCGYTWIGNGWRLAVGKQGPKWARLVYFKAGGLVGTKAIRGQPRMKPVEGLTPEKLARKFWRCGARRSSRSARKLLAAIK